MRVILRIARLELASLFYSPIAWLIFLVFAVQFGVAFTDKLAIYASQKALGYNTVNLSEYIFSHAQTPGVFLTVQSQLYLFVPLLTMGLISRELQSGSIKLLQSSPVSTIEIITGKYLGILIYGALLFILLLLYVCTAWVLIPHFEFVWMLTALGGLFLLYATYSAIGLFLSSLTSYQVVAAISTLVLLTFLHYVGSLWQDVDFVRQLTSFLSVGGKANSMIAGLLRSKDVLYFCIVIALFIGLSILKLETARASYSFAKKTIIYLSFISGCLLIGYASALPRLTGYVDLTSQKTRTLSTTGQEIVKKFDGPFTITTYVNLLDKDYNIGAKKHQNIDASRFEQYQRFMPDLKMDYVYYYDTSDNSALFQNKINAGLPLEKVAQNVAETYSLSLGDFLPPSQIREDIDLSGEGNRLVRTLQYGNRSTYLRLYNDYFKHPGETNIVAALKTLQSGPARVAFVDSHDSRSIQSNSERGYRQVSSDITQRNALVNNGFEVMSFDLRQDAIPSDIHALVLADPREEIEGESLDKIISYLEKGGNLLVFAEPDQYRYLGSVIEYLGLDFDQGALVQQHSEIAPNVVYARLTEESSSLGKIFDDGKKDQKFKTVMISPGSLIQTKETSFTYLPLLKVTDSNAWIKNEKINPDSLRVSFDPSQGDIKKEAIAAIGLTRDIQGDQQKIAVIADADFISNIEMGTFRKTGGNSNSEFYTGLFEWFTSSEYPILIDPILPVDNDILLSNTQAKRFKFFYVYLLPLAIFILGAVILTLRKRK